ncbi:P-loop containing nucleoside triphosphate hydrolase protein [Kockovaella imperatae]|uniref:ATP-dependent RNA helicase n=1 Tax=Kockovaella imperatae TaxID=4999 RepID=A0A1Y1UD94_9TREE|nr:P-loop containing nucleoside triphosphate hydrolase protein [Kockovaella imperatae]ORX36028.1 P-loop containing nucleoside triphosphate hydrolase protein [Kockovaella imperatae]
MASIRWCSTLSSSLRSYRGIMAAEKVALSVSQGSAGPKRSRYRPHRRPASTQTAPKEPLPARSTTPKPVDGPSFTDIAPGLDPALLKNLPFQTCTEVQAATLPAILNGDDVLAQAKTGTGKTVAFLLPSIQRLLSSPMPSPQHTTILAISPTRELAQQIAVTADGLLNVGAHGGNRYRVQCVVGGTNMRTDLKQLQSQRCDVLVATPGRLIDLLDNGGIQPRFAQLKTLVLDEADRLLDQGFRRELAKIISMLPSNGRQTLLFSATLPKEVENIASIALKKEHKFISTLKEEDVNVHQHVRQESVVVPGNDIVAATYVALQREYSLRKERGGFKVMVFLPTARSAAIYRDVFLNLEMPCPVWEIHSRMSQPARAKATEEFRQASTGVLFSSDVTARGIDVKGISAVIQVGLPSSADQYIHRLGRTARAGAEGHGVIVLGDFESHFLTERTIKTLPIQPITLPPLDSAHGALQMAFRSVSDDDKAKAYSAWLGYYRGSMKAMKWKAVDLVQAGNAFARHTLHYGEDAVGDWKPPGLLAKTVGMMGLRGTPGLNVVKEPPREPRPGPKQM